MNVTVEFIVYYNMVKPLSANNDSKVTTPISQLDPSIHLY